MADRITLVAPDGSIGTVPAEQAQKALEQGYRQPNQEERQLEAAAEHPFRAAAEGFARGLIPGIDQAFINAGENPKALKLREEANPKLSFAGELGGNLVQTLAVPEVSAEVGASKAAQFAASLAKPAIEGGLMGLGQVVNESTLENRPLLGEDIGSSILGGAVLGGGIAAGFKGAGALVRMGRSKLLGAGVKGMPVEKLVETATPEAERILLTPSMEVKPLKLTPEMEQGAFQRADTLVDETVASPGKASAARSTTPEPFFGPTKSFTTPEEIEAELQRFNRMREAGFKTVQEFESAEGGTVNQRAPKAAEALPREQLDEAWKAYQSARAETLKEVGVADGAAAEAALKEPRSFLGKLADELAFSQLVRKRNLNRYGLFGRKEGVMATAREYGIFGEGIDALKATHESVNKKAGEVAQQLRKDVLDSLSEGARFDPQAAASRIEAELLTPAEVSGDASSARYVRPLIEDLVTHNGGSFENALSHYGNWGNKVGPTDPQMAKELLFKAKGLLRDEIDRQLTEQGGSGARFQKLMRDYGNVRALEEASNDRLKEAIGNNTFGMSDFFGGNLLSGVSGGNPIAALAGAGAAHVAKSRGGFIAAGALDMLSNSRFAKNAAKGLSSLLEKQLDAVPELFGKLEPGLRTALAKGGNALLQEHLRIARSHQGPEYLALLGLQDEHPENAHEFVQRAHIVGQLDEHTEELQAALRAPFKKVGEFKSPTHSQLTKKQLAKQMQELQSLMMDPSQLTQHLPTDASLFPEITATALATAQRGAQYLLDKAPKDPNAGLPPAYRQPWEPSKADLAEWSNYANAVADPVGCLARALKGDNVRCTMDVLKNVYPDMLSEMQAQAIQHLSEAARPLTYKQRLLLSPVLGSQVFNMSPENQMLLQSILSPQQPEQGRGGGGRSPSDGRQRVDVEKNYQTQTQRTEAR